MLLFLLLVRVAADGDDADRGAGGVGNDNRLPLPLPGGAGGPVAPPACDGRAAGRAAVHQGAARRRVLLDTLGPLRGADGLRGGHLTGGDVSVTTKPHLFREAPQLLPRSPTSRDTSFAKSLLQTESSGHSDVFCNCKSGCLLSSFFQLLATQMVAAAWPSLGSGRVPCACPRRKGAARGCRSFSKRARAQGLTGLVCGGKMSAQGLRVVCPTTALPPQHCLQGQGLTS